LRRQQHFEDFFRAGVDFIESVFLKQGRVMMVVLVCKAYRGHFLLQKDAVTYEIAGAI